MNANTDSRKINIIEAVLKTDDENVLFEVERIIEQNAKQLKKDSVKQLFGAWDKRDAELIEKAIEDGCEQIHPDDWK